MKKTMTSNIKSIALLSAGVLLGMLGFKAIAEFADGEHAKLIPYQGYLEEDGIPFNGSKKMRFEISRPHPQQHGEYQPLWTETHNSVDVFDGNFSVILGESESLNDPVRVEDEDVEIFSNPQLFIKVILFEGVGRDAVEVPLEGRQRLLASPFAIASAGNFKVNGTLNVQGQTVLSGGNIGRIRGNAEGVNNNTVALKIIEKRENNESAHMIIDGNQIEGSEGLYIQPSGIRNTFVGGEFLADKNIQVGLPGDEESGYVYALRGIGVGPALITDIYTYPRFGGTLGSVVRSADQVNGIRGEETDLGPADGRVCFLTYVDMLDLDGNNERGACRVYIRDRNWYVRAHGGQGYDNNDGVFSGTVRCEANCLVWNE